MQFRSVKVGEVYHRWGDRSPWRAIEKRDDRKAGGTYWPEVLLRSDSGDEQLTAAAALTPWREYLDAEHEQALGLDRLCNAAATFEQLVGGGIQRDGLSGNFCTLNLSEAAAEQVLALCGAKPLPEERRPSLVPEGDERQHRRYLLALRLRRALGCGQAAMMLVEDLVGQETYMARMMFSDLDLAQAVDRLRGTDARPALSEMLASA